MSMIKKGSLVVRGGVLVLSCADCFLESIPISDTAGLVPNKMTHSYSPHQKDGGCIVSYTQRRA